MGAAVHFDSGFYYTYAGYSSTGNLLGLWELLSVVLFLTWSLGISVAGYIEGALLWERYEAMETVGKTVTIVEGYKYLPLVASLASVPGSLDSPSVTLLRSSSV